MIIFLVCREVVLRVKINELTRRIFLLTNAEFCDKNITAIWRRNMSKHVTPRGALRATLFKLTLEVSQLQIAWSLKEKCIGARRIQQVVLEITQQIRTYICSDQRESTQF